MEEMNLYLGEKKKNVCQLTKKLAKFLLLTLQGKCL